MEGDFTTRFRILAWGLFTLADLATIVGWLFLNRDPAQMGVVLAWTASATGIGEASNVGKRFSFDPEAVGSGEVEGSS